MQNLIYVLKQPPKMNVEYDAVKKCQANQ